MRKLSRKIWNFVFFGKWTDCPHLDIDLKAVGMMDWKCKRCGATT